MIGAVIFVIFFLAFLGISLGISLPPGNMIFDILKIPMTDYPVLGIPANTLIPAIVNGVVYGFIIWLIFSVVSAVTGRNKKKGETISQSVTVHVGDKEKEPLPEKKEPVESKETK